MRVCHIRGGDLSTLFLLSRVSAQGREYAIGDRILCDTGEFTAGPLKIVGLDGPNAVVVADEDYCIFEPVTLDDVDTAILEPICEVEYTPVTDSIYLDGFLSAAYLDEENILRIDVNERLPALKRYFADLLERNEINHHVVSDGFIFTDSGVIEDVFSRQHGLMPPKYTIGFLCSFLLVAKPKGYKNTKYARYFFALSPERDLYDELAPEHLYYLDQNQNQLCGFSIFGSFEPLSVLIDAVDTEIDTPVFKDATHSDEIFRGVVNQLVFNLFKYAGYQPRSLSGQGPFGLEVLDRSEDGERLTLYVSERLSDVPSDADYAVIVEGRELYLYSPCESAEGRAYHKDQDLLLGGRFTFSKELSEYYKIILRKI